MKSLEAALWAFRRTSDFRSGCLAAVNLGDDADTTGAVYGQLAGAFYGASGIPAEWIERLALRERIEELAARLAEGLTPDFGPSGLHPTAGGVIVGARRPLIAFNVDLRGATLDDARMIASAIRERDGGFPGVRALGLELPGSGRVQVSMNVEDWEAAALHEIVARIESEAVALGVELDRAELVGLMPAGAAAAAAGSALRIQGFDGSRLIETRLLED